ncbi:MAG: hypothetical protein GXP33_00075 [Spirochaetes bacterium]|nr:hypothetical protein [Spirochaetota bacterium]
MKTVKLRIKEGNLEILKGTFKPEIALERFSILKEYDFKNKPAPGNSMFDQDTGAVDLFDVKGLEEISDALKRVVSTMEG